MVNAAGGGGVGSWGGTIDVDLASLGTIAGRLVAGREALEGVQAAPPAVEAGPMTEWITTRLSRAAGSAGEISKSIAAAAELTRLSKRYYERADADARAGFSEIRQAMGR